MRRIKSEKGVTMVALALTLMILAVLSIPVAINTTKISDFNRYAKLKGDIDTISEAVSNVYFRKDNLAGIGPLYTGDISFLNASQGSKVVRNPNDDATYYVIDYNKLRNDMPTTLKNLDFGSVNTIVPTSLREYNSTTLHGTVPTTDEEWLEVNDVFIINNASHQVYYVAGVEYKGIVYHKLADD